MIKILLHCPIASDATSFYRGFGPFNRLEKDNPEIQIVNGSDNFEYNWHTLQNIDIIFLQRPSTSECLNIIMMAKRHNKPVWIDYDDDYIKIPKTNPRHDLYKDNIRQVQIRECMQLADVITVSTEYIKNCIEEEVKTKAEIIILPNATDFRLFTSSPVPKNKIVLWRGGDTHVRDVEVYEDAVKECFDKHPEYTWVFYGHKFDWMIKHAMESGCPGRIQTYEFTDLMGYFKNIMQIRPEIMIVPLEDNDFNRAKSTISWQEGTMAGATVMASALPEFINSKGCAVFENQEEFIKAFETLATSQEVRKELFIESIKNIPNLSNINKKRLEIIESIRLNRKKFAPRLVEIEPWDDKIFFEHALLFGNIQEIEQYKSGHHRVADWLINKLAPESMIEFGCGPGPMLERFLINNVPSLGLEINDYFIEYFQQRNPVFEDRIMKCDFANQEFDLEATDLGISIEVFEHIDKPEEWWNEFILKLAKQMKYFYFSSTPNQSSVEFDKQWGHVNVRQIEAWIDLFERNGWKLIEKPKQICSWDLLFESDRSKINQEPSFKNFDSKKLKMGS